MKDATSAGISRITEEGKITLNGTPESLSYSETIYTFIAKESGVYTLLPFKKTAVSSIRLIFKVNDGRFISNDSQTQISLNENDVLLINLRIDALDKITNFSLQPMLYLGTDIKPFEQYGASPSPSFLSKIETVVGNNINEFDGELELGSIGNNDGKNYGTAKNTRSKNYLAVEENTTYAFSDNINGSFIVHAYDKDKNWLKMIGASNRTGKYIFTTPQQTAYIRFRTNETDLSAKIKLEKGSTATSYSPYRNG